MGGFSNFLNFPNFGQPIGVFSVRPYQPTAEVQVFFMSTTEHCFCNISIPNIILPVLTKRNKRFYVCLLVSFFVEHILEPACSVL